MASCLACFSCHLDFHEGQWHELSTSGNPQLLINHLRTVLRRTPLEIVAGSLIRYEDLFEPAKKLFDAYDRFIGLMAEEEQSANCKSPRAHLDELVITDLDEDLVYQEARNIRREFRTALAEIFLDQKSALYDLTIRYGVF